MGRSYTARHRDRLLVLSDEVWDLATKIEKTIPSDRGLGQQKIDREVAIELLRIAAERLYP